MRLCIILLISLVQASVTFGERGSVYDDKMLVSVCIIYNWLPFMLIAQITCVYVCVGVDSTVLV